MCQRKIVNATTLSATTGFQAAGRRSRRSAAGVTRTSSPSWKTARAAMVALVGKMLDSPPPTVATIERG